MTLFEGKRNTLQRLKLFMISSFQVETSSERNRLAAGISRSKCKELVFKMISFINVSFFTGFWRDFPPVSWSNRHSQRCKRNHRVQIHVQGLFSSQSVGTRSSCQCLHKLNFHTRKSKTALLEKRIWRGSMPYLPKSISFHVKKQLKIKSHSFKVKVVLKPFFRLLSRFIFKLFNCHIKRSHAYVCGWT